MKLVIYRDRETKEIKQFHDFRPACTDENIKAWNENPKYDTFVEVVELEENSLAYYFYTMKTRNIKDEIESLRMLEDDLRDLASEIEDRLYSIEKAIEENDNERT
jgi:hypothetical protein